MKFSKYHITTDLLDEMDMVNQRIIFSTRTGISILITEDIYQKLLKNDFKDIDDEYISSFIECELLINEDEDEYQKIISENKVSTEEVDVLSMTIQPSANCQLGCHYCGQTHSKDYASTDIIDLYLKRIIHFLDSEKKYSGLNIIWYGGEPLTGLKSIRIASMLFKELCEKRDLNYSATMVTNGLSLKLKLFEELVTLYKINHFQITLDATAESHDTRRVTKDRKPTFDLIIKNIKEITSSNFYSTSNAHISIRINIDKTNHHLVDDFIDFIKVEKLGQKVSLTFAPIVDWGGNDAGKDGLSNQMFADKEIEWMLKCFENDININKLLPKRTYYACMVERKDSEVYDAFGNIYSCWEFPYTSTYKEGNSLIGNLKDDYSTFNENATLRNWSEVLDTGTTWCKTCLHLPVCGGACPKSWHEKTPACPPFKYNFKDKLLLDYYIRQKKIEKTEN
jgi:uncharacterized protein